MALYKVNDNGKAPAGLSVGDEVVTGGGTYKITGVNADGTYKSELSNKAQTTYNTTGYTSRDNGLLGRGASDYTNQRVQQLETGYTPSATVQAAQNYLSSVQAGKPGVYESKWSSQLDDMYNKIVNRDKFTYDLGTDPLYQQYRQQYQNLGRTAMMDTMGQAAALTGGYGSSYGQSVGQQTYDAYLQKLNDVVPELYGQALNQYNAEGAELYNQYNLLNSREQADYGAYRDTVSDYYNDLNYAQNAYNNALSQDYQQYANQLNYWTGKQADENAAYLSQQAALAKGTGSSAKTPAGKTSLLAPEYDQKYAQTAPSASEQLAKYANSGGGLSTDAEVGSEISKMIDSGNYSRSQLTQQISTAYQSGYITAQTYQSLMARAGRLS